jgi:photosystem II stability/assembly factor-like uncharacterized protein
MKHKLVFVSLLIVLIGLIGIFRAGKTAVLSPLSPPLISPLTTTDNWQSMPGPTGISVADIVLSPAYPTPQTLFAGLRGRGVYRSDDGAYSWQATGSGNWVVSDLAISPDFANDETLFALTGQFPTGFTVQRSVDGAESWQPASSSGSILAARRLAISPNFANDQLIYLITGTPNLTYVSTDGGSTFAAAVDWFASHQVNELLFSPVFASDLTMFALVANDGIYRSVDAGSSWQPVETSRSYSALAVSPNYAVDTTITAVSSTGSLYTSTDDGATWNVGSGPSLSSAGAISLQFSPTFATDHVIMAASSLDSSPIRSVDGGVNWELAGPYDPATAYQDGMIGGNVNALALAPEQDWDGVQFAATSSGVARSPYQGDGWLQMNDGLPRLAIRSLALAPGNPDIMLAGSEFYETRFFDSGSASPGNGNVQWSQDGGQHWRHVTGRLARVNAVAFSPNFAVDETAFAAAGMIGQHGLSEGSIYRSQDNSVTWTPVFTHTFFAFQTLAVSPNFAVDETVWASAITSNSVIGLYQSTNGGDNWTLIAPGLNINLLAVSPNFAVDQTLFAGLGGDGIHRSVDGGLTWTRVLDVAYPAALAISPAYGSSRTVYAAARADLSDVTAVYRSTDNGMTWQELNTGIPDQQNGTNRNFTSLAFAVDGSVLAGVQYGSGESASVYRSADGGASWQLIDSTLAASRVNDFASRPTGSFDVVAATNIGLERVTISQGTAAEPGGWQSSGPRGGSGDALAVSPDFATDGIAFTGEWYGNFQGGEAGSGIIKSTNFGQNWAVSAAGMNETGNETAVHDYAFSNNFTSDQTVFAATGGGLFQSIDGGATWNRNEALYQGPPGIINRVVAAPDFAASGHIMATGGYGGLFLSQDAGGSWTTAISNSVGSLAYSPAFAADSTAFISEFYYDGVDYRARIAKTENSGLTWTEAYSASVTSLAVSPNYATDQTVFAGGSEFHISTDGGTTWMTRTVAAGSYNIWSLAVSPNFATDQTIFAGTSIGLYHSADGGNTWQVVPGYEETAVLSLALSPDWPTHAVLLVGTHTGIYRLLTTDMNNGVIREATQGLITLPATVMAMAPDESLLLTGANNHGLYASGDAGHSWQPFGFNGGSTFSSVRALAFSPDFATDQTLFVAQGEKYTSYYRSTDAGATWDSLYGIYNNASIAISPEYATDQTLFATGEDSGEFKKSTDGGDTWQEIVSWDRARGGSLIVLPPDYPGNGRLFVGAAQGFWLSVDNGVSWQQAATGLVDGYMVTSLKVSPDYPLDQTLLATANWSSGPPDYIYYRAVFRSSDGGINWAQAMTGLPADSEWIDTAFSPNFAQDHTAYALSTTALYRSLDGGMSWTIVGSPPNQPALSHLLVDSSGQVFVSSDMGVWRYGTMAQDIIINGRFEANSAWDLPFTPIPAEYSTQVVYNGQRSMRVGLDNGVNATGYSSARQTFTLPDDPLLAALSFYVYPVTGEETAVIAEASSPENALHNANVAAAADAQYVYLYDANTQDYLETLYWDVSNEQAWQHHTVNLNAYGGQQLLLLFGVINDGQNGTTGMYVDDVSLLVIDGSLLPEKTYLPVIMKQ